MSRSNMAMPSGAWVSAVRTLDDEGVLSIPSASPAVPTISARAVNCPPHLADHTAMGPACAGLADGQPALARIGRPVAVAVEGLARPRDHVDVGIVAAVLARLSRADLQVDRVALAAVLQAMAVG